MFLKLNNNQKLENLNKTRQLEYLESTGTQYINTGISLTDNIIVKIKGESINFGIVHQGAVDGLWFSILQHTNNTGLAFCGTNYSMVTINNFYNTEHCFELKYKSYIKMDNTILKEGTWNPPLVNKSMLLFQAYDINAGKAEQRNGCKIHYFIIEQNDVEVLHLIAALDDNDIPCMYDTISETFFYNQGTGDFIAGPIASFITRPIAVNVDKLFIKDCPLLNTYTSLKSIYDVQSDNGNIILSRVRLDIGNVSGSLSELLQYAGMAGFNDAGEEQAKPRLVGTWTINDWYTTAQLAQARAAFDGLTVVEDPNYVIDFSQMAVQVLDPNEDNYNPAVAIILQGQNLGTTMTDAPLGYGRWFMSKTQAAAVTNISNWFTRKTTVTDTSGIVSYNTAQTYDFESFDEFIYFTGFNVIGTAFYNCTKLKSIYLPDNIIELRGGSSGDGTMADCVNLIHIHIPSSLQIVGNFALCHLDSLEESIEFPTSVTKFQYGCMVRGTKIPYIHINSTTRPTLEATNAFNNTTFKIYVGDGSSATNDDAILADYLADTNWSTYSSRLDTWYNYLHPTT